MNIHNCIDLDSLPLSLPISLSLSAVLLGPHRLEIKDIQMLLAGEIVSDTYYFIMIAGRRYII